MELLGRPDRFGALGIGNVYPIAYRTHRFLFGALTPP